ncbi:heavy metal-binding domain-containing protein [Synechococcales cyanobacterium C]|uniref:Heavy metal-binding domain-containing protein n=1 Tax=Petrachloros mirabilis ULC683 TaxID=2781853 RepID=A0A8K1ZWD5_9CYAN|nr:heavy metal-binding domain-containing protein [Petrachloros mirabilis]NCJ06108.1 heavy metal-binding domain-containing protein [Petrachloros mirabilis ULC683]
MIELLIFLGLLAIGYSVGSLLERRHFEDLAQREQQTQGVMLLNIGAKPPLPPAQAAQLFMGSVVISSDYFKTFLALLFNLMGGRIESYETLLERGRREALLRMKEEAIAWGATQVINVRLETASLGDQSGQSGLVALEVIAYGTGIR